MEDDTGISEEAQTEGIEATGEGEGNPWSGVGYHDRMRQDPEFAVAEIKKKDSYIGEINQRLSKVKTLEPYLDAVGGSDALVELASLGHQIKSNPTLQQALNDALQGKAPGKAPEPEDDIYDPEIKAVRDRFKSQIEEQAEVIRDLQQRLSRTEVHSLKGSLTENMESALERFRSDPELMEEAKSAILQSIETVEKAAANGDRSAAHQLDQLSGPNGSRTLRMMTLDIYDKLVDKRAAGQASQKPNGEAIRSKATDDRAGVRSSVPSEKIEVKSGVKVTSQLARQVLEQVTRNFGKDPKAIW